VTHYDRIVKGAGVSLKGRARISGVPGARREVALRAVPAPLQLAVRNNPGPRVFARIGEVRVGVKPAAGGGLGTGGVGGVGGAGGF
jgi:hypothetical protein